MQYAIPHVSYGSCALLASRKNKKTMMNNVEVRQLQKVTTNLIQKTFNLPKRGLKEPVEKMFYNYSVENIIIRDYLRNVKLFGH